MHTEPWIIYTVYTIKDSLRLDVRKQASVSASLLPFQQILWNPVSIFYTILVL